MSVKIHLCCNQEIYYQLFTQVICKHVCLHKTLYKNVHRALFIKPQTRNTTKVSINRRINKVWFIYIMKYYLVLQSSKLLAQRVTQMNIKNVLSEKSLTQKSTQCMNKSQKVLEQAEKMLFIVEKKSEQWLPLKVGMK